MLVLSRKRDQGVVLSMTREQIETLLSRMPAEKNAVVFLGRVAVAEVRGDRVRVGLDLPTECQILRDEVYEAHQTQAPQPPTAVELPASLLLGEPTAA